MRRYSGTASGILADHNRRPILIVGGGFDEKQSFHSKVKALALDTGRVWEVAELPEPLERCDSLVFSNQLSAVGMNSRCIKVVRPCSLVIPLGKRLVGWHF
jgi:hypothetical protein